MRWRRRGEIIRAERAKRWATAKDFARATGLSESLIDIIENGRRGNFSPATMAAIEEALDWADGSFIRVGEGGHPQRMRDADLQRIHRVWPELSADARRILATLAETGVSGRGSSRRRR